MTGARSQLAGPRRGAPGSVWAAIAAIQNPSMTRLKRFGTGSGMSGASFSAAC